MAEIRNTAAWESAICISDARALPTNRGVAAHRCWRPPLPTGGADPTMRQGPRPNSLTIIRSLRGYDESDKRDATGVYHHIPLLPFFSPGCVVGPERLASIGASIAPSMLSIATRYLPSPRIRSNPAATVRQTLRPSPLRNAGDRAALPNPLAAAPSYSPFEANTQSPRIPARAFGLRPHRPAARSKNSL